MNLPHFSASPLVEIAAGLVLLFMGRQLFWLFVGLIGFFAGLQFGHQFAATQPPAMLLLLALGCGLAGALLALLLQRIAVAIAGGLAGGMVALHLAASLGFTDSTSHLAAFVIGAVIAALLISVLFDWALILISALTGATMIVPHLSLAASLSVPVLLGLAVVGILVQGGFHLRTGRTRAV